MHVQYGQLAGAHDELGFAAGLVLAVKRGSSLHQHSAAGDQVE